MSANPPRTALSAFGTRRLIMSAWPLRSAMYVLSSVPIAMLLAVPLGLPAFPWALLARRVATNTAQPASGLILLVLGAALVAALGPLVARPLAAAERVRLRLVDHRPVPSVRRVPFGLSWYRQPLTWRELAYAVLLVTVVPVLYSMVAFVLVLIAVCALSPWLVPAGEINFGVTVITTPPQAVPYSITGFAALVTVPYLLTLVAGVHGAVARALLHPGAADELHAELVEVSRSRARLVNAFEAERRRIERDLHDGAQQKLVGLTLQLGLAKLDIPATSPAAGAVETAHQQAKQLMSELRELIHGIRPNVLTDLGLPAALRELADQCPVPVVVETDLPRRPPEQVEATAYFVVAEALTNVAKHSGARAVTVTARETAGLLTLEIRDDGRGGADPSNGTGLTGLADRVAVAAGRMLLSSPPGGPTLVRTELPCA
ncbi:histidine kinase [Sphaerisporangium melleum]|uniref:histidine kinase n=1 Tax=Sphaerisporangium melleum TaxID=321316 RepID=A0A917RCH0_9ACTN|nr:sensor histidine kinase [Sphaerisporangium melleum]GGK99740.1 histidine kinase [Sphaerisporangium melleum]GII73633.1 histidine kinase [Sphaerisporangium melleum]